MQDFLGSIRGKGREGNSGEIKKGQPHKALPLGKFIILAIILTLSVKVFFSVFLGGQNVLAETKLAEKSEAINQMDPLDRIGKSFLEDKCQNSSSLCQNFSEKEKSLFFEKEHPNLLAGYPIEEMLPAIDKLDKKTADFLIAIAKKESNWGRHAPSKNGQDCYNYWGYKGGGEQVLGYSCFGSAEQAVEVVGGRISDLLEKGINTPEKMLVWKCGATCAGHDPEGVRKWVADVESVLKVLKS